MDGAVIGRAGADRDDRARAQSGDAVLGVHRPQNVGATDDHRPVHAGGEGDRGRSLLLVGLGRGQHRPRHVRAMAARPGGRADRDDGRVRERAPQIADKRAQFGGRRLQRSVEVAYE
jgi:hypothetical protein